MKECTCRKCGKAFTPATATPTKADIVFCDPPYNVSYQGVKFDPIKNDSMAEDDFVNFSLAFMTRLRDNTRAGGVFYICSGYISYPVFLWAMKTTGLIFSTQIIWVKNAPAFGWGDYRRKYGMMLKATNSKRAASPILYGWKAGKHYFIDIKDEADVWEVSRRSTNRMIHPTQKPLGLVQRALRNSSKPKDLVLDPFAGSGSTLIAADRENRRAAIMELDPKYVDVIIRRIAAQGGPTEDEIKKTLQHFEPETLDTSAARTAKPKSESRKGHGAGRA